MRVRLDRAHDADAAPVSLLEVLLDRERGIDHDGGPGVLVADEVRRAAQVLVDELREDHSALTLAAGPAISLEVDGSCAATGTLRRR
jgi:hypothetical protein